jgi:hypothetical protein
MSTLTKPYLRRLRNEIPVTELIADVLRLEHRHSEGHWRFLCPLCQSFHTAVNPNTNLARCFDCRKNFNPIDLVLIVKRCDFRHAVAFLDPLLPDDEDDEDDEGPSPPTFPPPPPLASRPS